MSRYAIVAPCPLLSWCDLMPSSRLLIGRGGETYNCVPPRLVKKLKRPVLAMFTGQPSSAPCLAIYRRRGRPIPTNDMWIAASALQHGFAVFSDERHFHEVPGLHVGT